MSEVKKSRNLSVEQLFEILQEEYVVCQLRVKIYPHEKHQQYWLELAEKKKDKIIDIAQKNRLFSIFDSKKLEQDFNKRIIPEIGFPNFIYKDDHQRLMQEKWDIHNYYTPQAKVRVYCEEGQLVGTIYSTNFAAQVVTVKLDGESQNKDFSIESITRIL